LDEAKQIIESLKNEKKALSENFSHSQRKISEVSLRSSEQEKENAFLTTQLNELDLKHQKLLSSDQKKISDSISEIKSLQSQISTLQSTVRPKNHYQ
jgi:peptidoglycan hydrolase CwlO-like protein